MSLVASEQCWSGSSQGWGGPPGVWRVSLWASCARGDFRVVAEAVAPGEVVRVPPPRSRDLDI
jgi:hypothetical protein